MKQHETKGHDPISDLSGDFGQINRLRNAHRQILDLADSIPPLTTEQIHAIVESNRPTQFQMRRQADRYLLALSLLLIALAASHFIHTAPAGVTPLNIAILVLAVIALWTALRAALSLWFSWKTLRLRAYPYRMARYSDRLDRLSCHRRRWLRFVLHDNYDTTSVKNYFSLRIPAYTIAACIFLIIALNAGKAFATTHEFVKVTTTSEKTDYTIYDNIYIIMTQI